MEGSVPERLPIPATRLVIARASLGPPRASKWNSLDKTSPCEPVFYRRMRLYAPAAGLSRTSAIENCTESLESFEGARGLRSWGARVGTREGNLAPPVSSARIAPQPPPDA